MSFFLTQGEDEFLLTPAGYIALIIIMLLIFGCIYLIKGDNKKTSPKQLVFCAVAMALALVTSYLKVASLPFGGSITLFSMFFIVLIGYLYGPSIGITAGIAYGILQLIMEPYIYHPIQVLLDYPLAFGALGISGLFSNKKNGLVIGYLVGVIGRYIFHVLSGYIFFASYAPEGTNPLIYTLGYNATYIVPEMIATIIILLIPAVTKGISYIKKLAAE